MLTVSQQADYYRGNFHYLAQLTFAANIRLSRKSRPIELRGMSAAIDARAE